MNRNPRLPLTETVHYILLALLQPAHGYVIMSRVESMSDGAVRLAPGTLYGALENLVKQRLIVRVDYRPGMSAADFDDYRNLFWDAGWQHVAGTRGSGAQYFASFSGDADADIFSDSTSKAQRHRRAMVTTALLVLPFLAVTLALWAQGALSVELYLTPGLWEMQGWQFVRAFAFETPFALMRLAFPLLLIGSCVVGAAQIVYQWILYRRALAPTRV